MKGWFGLPVKVDTEPRSPKSEKAIQNLWKVKKGYKEFKRILKEFKRIL